MKGTNTALSTNKSRILVTDDGKSAHNVFLMLLTSKLGEKRIDVVANGLEAVESFRTVHHGAIVINLHAATKHSIQLYEKIKALCKTSNWEMPAFIFCTSFNPSSDLIKVITEDHRNRVLRKPLRPDLLVETVRQSLRKQDNKDRLHVAA